MNEITFIRLPFKFRILKLHMWKSVFSQKQKWKTNTNSFDDVRSWMDFLGPTEWKIENGKNPFLKPSIKEFVQVLP